MTRIIKDFTFDGREFQFDYRFDGADWNIDITGHTDAAQQALQDDEFYDWIYAHVNQTWFPELSRQTGVRPEPMARSRKMQSYTEEQLRLIKIAVSYLSANLDDVNEMLCADRDIKESDVRALMKKLKADNGTL